jgi:hypothetical protein
MFEAVIMGRSHPRLSFLFKRRAIRRLHRSIRFRILVFTRKPPCFGIGDVVVILNTSENAEGFRVSSFTEAGEPFGVHLAKA